MKLIFETTLLGLLLFPFHILAESLDTPDVLNKILEDFDMTVEREKIGWLPDNFGQSIPFRTKILKRGGDSSNYIDVAMFNYDDSSLFDPFVRSWLRNIGQFSLPYLKDTLVQVRNRYHAQIWKSENKFWVTTFSANCNYPGEDWNKIKNHISELRKYSVDLTLDIRCNGNVSWKKNIKKEQSGKKSLRILFMNWA